MLPRVATMFVKLTSPQPGAIGFNPLRDILLDYSHNFSRPPSMSGNARST